MTVPHRHARADDERPARRVGRRPVRYVQHAVVLDVARLADADRVDVAADHRARPHRSIGPEADLTDHRGARMYPGAGGKRRGNAVMRRQRLSINLVCHGLKIRLRAESIIPFPLTAGCPP